MHRRKDSGKEAIEHTAKGLQVKGDLEEARGGLADNPKTVSEQKDIEEKVRAIDDDDTLPMR